MFEDIIGDVASDANQLIADVKAWQAQINAAGISATINTSAPQAATAGSATVTSAISAVNAAGQAATAAGQNAMSIAQQAQMNPTLQQQLAQSMIMLPNGAPLNAMTLMQVAQAATTAGQQASALGQSGAALASGADATSWLAQANTATSNANTAATNANNASQQLQMLMTSSAPYIDAGYGGGSYGGGGGGGFGGGGGDFGGGGGGGDDSGVDWGDDSGQSGQEDDYAAAQSMLDDVAAQTGDYSDDSGYPDDGSDMSDLDMSDFDSSDLFAPMVVGKQVHPSVVLGAAFAEARGKRLYQHVLGIDVEAVKQRFDELDPTNNNVKSMWLDNGHGLALAQRLDSDAQKILNTAVLPTNEFQFHDAILAFGKRAMALSDKVSALPRDDNKSPLWEEVRSYFIDGSNLANQVEGVADGSLKWSDVKDSVVSMAHGIEQGGARVGTAIQWSTYAIVGGAVVLGGGILYALYKAITSDTGKAVAVTATRAAMLR